MDQKPTLKMSFSQAQRQVIGKCISIILSDYSGNPPDIAGDEVKMHRHRLALSLGEIAFMHNWNFEDKNQRSVTLTYSRIIDLLFAVQEVNAFLPTELERFTSGEVIFQLFTAIINGPKKSKQ